MKLLVANANTTQAVTDIVVAEARRHTSPTTEIIGATAAFGVAIVSNEAENAVAGHAALDLLARHAGQVDAVLLAISFDTALAAAQALMPCPVIGMTAAALHTACLLGRSFGLVTFGASSRTLYLDLVAREGLTGRMTRCESVILASAALYLEPGALDAAALEAIKRLADLGAASVVIAGAATAGMAPRLQPSAPVQLLDGVGCGVRQAELMVGLGAHGRRESQLAKDRAPIGLGAALSSLLQGPA